MWLVDRSQTRQTINTSIPCRHGDDKKHQNICTRQDQWLWQILVYNFEYLRLIGEGDCISPVLQIGKVPPVEDRRDQPWQDVLTRQLDMHMHYPIIAVIQHVGISASPSWQLADTVYNVPYSGYFSRRPLRLYYSNYSHVEKLILLPKLKTDLVTAAVLNLM